MNFKTEFLEGKKGRNIGLTTGIPQLDKAINGIQKKHTYSIAAAPKVGKTTLCDYSFILSPYLQAEKEGKLDKIHWIYHSFEIDRISKEFKFAAFFMGYDYGIYTFEYKGVVYPMSQNYLTGQLLHKKEDNTLEQVVITPEHEELLKKIYVSRIIPLFGEFDDSGRQISKGKITFIPEAENPTGLYKSILRYAKDEGDFIEEDFYTLSDDGKTKIKRKRIIGYKPTDPDKMTIIVTDHIRKLKRENVKGGGNSMKENIDKWLEYSTYLRNICKFTFVHIVHMNRNLSNMDRLKLMGEFLYPTGDDIKDSGNISEETTVLLTMFNPQDEKYNIQKHFGLELEEHPNYRSIHVADSRYTDCPQHIQVNMFGGVNTFTPINY